MRPPNRGTAARPCLLFCIPILAATACVGGADFAGPSDASSLSVAASLVALDAEVSALDRVVARAIAPPDRVIGSFEQRLTESDDDIEIVLDVDLSLGAPVVHVEVELWAGPLLAFAGTSSGSLSSDVPNSWGVELEPRLPILRVSESEFTIDLEEGGEETLRIDVSNGGIGTLSWTAESDADWLTLPAPTGEAGDPRQENSGRGLTHASGNMTAGADAGISVRVLAADLLPGEHRATLSIRAPGALSAPSEIQVLARVSPRPSGLVTVTGGGAGKGHVRSDPRGIQCSIGKGEANGACQVEVPLGTEIVLTAEASGKDTFNGWGGACSGATDCHFVVGGATTVQAIFDAAAVDEKPKDSTPPQFSTDLRELLVTQVRSTKGWGTEHAVVVRNTGGERGRLRAHSDATWLRVRGGGGWIAPGGSAVLSVSAAGDLTVGRHSAMLWIGPEADEGSDAGGGVGVPVTVAVESPPAQGRLSLESTRVAFASEAGEVPRPDHADVELRNVGGGPLRWTAQSDAEWLELDQSSGELGAGRHDRLRLTARTASLEPGTHQVTVVLTASGPEGESLGTAELIVEAVVSAPPAWVVGPTRIEVSAPAAHKAATQIAVVTLEHTTGPSFRWKAKETASWLSLSRRSGPLDIGEVVEVEVEVDPSRLEPGRYEATVVFEAVGLAGLETEVTVVLEVTPSS